MYYLSILLLSVVAAASFAVGGAPAVSRATFRIEGKPVQLTRLEASRLLLSADCVEPDSGQLVESCEAVRAARRVSFRKLAISRFGGAEPGASVCKQDGGVVLTGRDSDGDEASFCRYGDGSVVATDSLHYHAGKNDE